MQDKNLFEYAVIRIVPHVEREEFLNVGIILLCASKKFLTTKIHIDITRLKAICPKLELDEVEGFVRSFEKICKGGNDGGEIGKLSLAERFRWLTATRSTMVQTSKVHPGLCDDPAEMTERLYKQLVDLPQ